VAALSLLGSPVSPGIDLAKPRVTERVGRRVEEEQPLSSEAICQLSLLGSELLDAGARAHGHRTGRTGCSLIASSRC
jgi:hypothetical protein